MRLDPLLNDPSVIEELLDFPFISGRLGFLLELLFLGLLRFL
jgi:hypothetical protein